MSQGFADRLRTIAENVLTLEVNTIVADDISGQKMPRPEHALIDLATQYRDHLADRYGRKEQWPEGSRPCASAEVFRRIREAAKALLGTPGADARILTRLQANAEQIGGMFDRLDRAAGRPVVLTRAGAGGALERPAEVDLLPDEVITVRKAWELGLDQVAMQTTIQIDGDVLTRMARDLGTRSDGPTIMRIHEKAVVSSTASWERIVGLIGSALKGLADLFRGGG